MVKWYDQLAITKRVPLRIDGVLCSTHLRVVFSRRMLNALIIGGTGLISTGITKHLMTRGANVTMYNRGRSGATVPGVRHIVGDRTDSDAFVKAFANSSMGLEIEEP